MSGSSQKTIDFNKLREQTTQVLRSRGVEIFNEAEQELMRQISELEEDNAKRELRNNGDQRESHGSSAVPRNGCATSARPNQDQWQERTRLAEERSRILQKMMVELIDTEERVRHRTALFLHDDLQQLLAGARLQQQTACSTLSEDSPSLPAFLNVDAILEESIEKSRRLSHELSPPVLHRSGLQAGLEWLVRQMSEQFELQTDLSADTAKIVEHPQLKVFLFRAVQQLLLNIVKHAGSKEARVSFTHSDIDLVVTVSDTGKGFDPRILESAARPNGSGLVYLRERARALGGNLAIRSASGQGSQLTLTVPLGLVRGIEPAELEPEIQAEPILPLARNEALLSVGDEAVRVLFADDHRVIRQGLIGMMEDQPGIKVVGEAANGREALEQVQALHPNVVVMDVSMPVMDGVEATRRIKAEWPNVRVIGLSMFDDEQIVRTMQQAGAEAFVNKAVSTDELLKAVYGTEDYVRDRKSAGGMAVYLQDYTDRKEMEEKLRRAIETEEKHRQLIHSIMEHIPMGITIADAPDMNIRAVSRYGRALIEQDSDRSSGSPLVEHPEKWRIYHADGVTPATMEEIPLTRATLHGKVVMEEEWVIISGSGNPIPILCTAAPIWNEKHEITGGVFGWQDITNIKKAEDQLRQAQKMEAIGRLAGGVAHEFNNMLQVIIGYADILGIHLGEENSLNKYVQEIQKTARRSADMTGQLLAYSRKQMIRPRVIDFNKVVQDQKSMLDRLIGENIEIRFHPAHNLWPVRIDPSQVDQVLTNLTVNSRDAIHENGQVIIETENQVVPPEQAQPDMPSGEYVCLTFSDTGIGMDHDTLEKIFDPYFTTKDVGKGTGLGLATVYGIVKQNKGAIRVKSRPGAGTTFVIYFPRSPVGTDSQKISEKKALPGGKETILVVEDEKQVLDLAEIILGHSGYRVLKADSPDKALEIARRKKEEIDLLLSDVVMPGMNGRMLETMIRELQPRIRTIFMSGHTEIDFAAEKNGRRPDFIRKPFSAQSLTEKVRKILDRR